MNWDAISAVSETIASIAVVISLIYLAIQIRHSNKLAHSQTRTELRHMASIEVQQMVEYPEIQLLYTKEKLDVEEKVKLHYFLIGNLRFREFIWRQYQLGLLDKATFDHYLIPLLGILSTDRAQRWWHNFKSPSYDPEFIRFVDDLLARGPLMNIEKHLDIL